MPPPHTRLAVALLVLAGCADTRPPPDPPRPLPPKPPALFEALALGTPWPKPMTPSEPPPPADLPATLEDKPLTLHPRAACETHVAAVSADIAFPLTTEDAVTAAVAYGQRVEARFLREGFTDAGGPGGPKLEEGLFRGKAEGTYESSFGWNDVTRTLRVHCADKRCDVIVGESWSVCPGGGPPRVVGAR